MKQLTINQLVLNNDHSLILNFMLMMYFKFYRGRRGSDRMVVGCITTYAISAYYH
jgi:hypothetical protein